MTIEQIIFALTSDDVELMRLCVNYIDRLTGEEKGRGQRAEDRAQAILSLSGIGATIVAGLLGLFYQIPPSLSPFLLALFGGSLAIMLAKSVYYSLKTVEPSKGYQVNEEFVFEVQEVAYIQALRQDLAEKVWLYRKNVPLISRKLFYLHRAVRNLAAFIIVFLSLSFVSLFLRTKPGLAQHPLTYGLGCVLFVASMGYDAVAERRGDLWKKSRQAASRQTKKRKKVA